MWILEQFLNTHALTSRFSRPRSSKTSDEITSINFGHYIEVQKAAFISKVHHPHVSLIANFYLYAMRGNNKNQMRRRRKAEAGLLLMNAAAEEDDWLWSILLHGGCAGSSALAKKRTAPVGCVGWRFHHDSLGSHACLHCVWPQKTQSCSKGPTKADNSK